METTSDQVVLNEEYGYVKYFVSPVKLPTAIQSWSNCLKLPAGPFETVPSAEFTLELV